MKKLSIVIPAYNEAKTIHLILDKIQEVKLIGELQKEVIVSFKKGNLEALKR